MARMGTVGRLALAIGVATTALVFAGDTVTVKADDNALILPGGGPTVELSTNAVLRIDGRLRYFRNCDSGVNDFVYPATDVYIVDSSFDPSTGPINQVIEEASGAGAPNTIVQPGTAFVGQLIAITGPTGTLGPGTYSIVYDTCQDGRFQFSKGDEIFRNAITVVYPPEIPPVDDSIAALKTTSYGEWGRWQEIGKLFDSLVAVNNIAGCGFGEISDCLSVLKIWVDSPSIQKWIGIYGNVKTGAECVGGKVSACFGILADYWGFDSTPIRSAVIGGAKSIIANQAKSFFGVYADPPRADFDQPSSVRLDFPVPTVRGDSPIMDSISGFSSALEREQLLWDALLAAVERYQGAQAAGDPVAARAQLRSAIGIATVLDDAGLTTATRLDSTLDTVDLEFPDLATVTARRTGEITRYRSSGLTPEEDRTLRNAGIGGPDRTAFLDETVELARTVTTTDPMANLRVLVDDLAADQTPRAAMLTTLIADLADVDASITGPGTDDVPTLSIPAVTAATAGEPVSIASSSTGASLVEWDFDADGDFGDAAGATATPTFASAGHRVIAARATNAAGVVVTAHGLVDVTSTNAPPVITSATPGAAATGTVGAPSTFTVTANDPTGEPLRYRWFVDDVPVDGATSPTLTLTPTPDDRGAHTVQVYVHDPRPGNMAQHAWRWSVNDVDADGDGWSANDYADCDDTNGDVHPRRPEQLYNDIDDDCDPATPDRPLELGAGQLWGWGTADGANGTGSGVGSATPRFAGVDRVSQIAASWIAGALVDEDGNAWAWGSGAMPGDGVVSGTPRPLPTPVLSVGGSGQLGGVTQLSSSFFGFQALLQDSRVVTWGGQWGLGGANTFGQGNAPGVQQFSPVPGYVVGEDLQPITGIVSVEGGYGASYAIRSDGTAMHWGTRICTPSGLAQFSWAVPAPQLGTDIVQIEAGNQSLFVRHGDGTVSWCNDTSRLPTRLTLDTFGGQAAVDMATIPNGQGGFVLTEDGSVWVTGPTAGNAQTNGLVTEQPITPTGFVKVVLPAGAPIVSLDGEDVACAIFAVRADGTALSWGDTNRNCDGQGPDRTLVNGAAAPGVIPVAGNVLDVSGGGYNSLALVARQGADVWSWGQEYGAGRGGDLSRPAPIPGLTNVVEVQTWFRHGYALKSNGEVVGWGLNDNDAGGFATQLGPVRGVGGVGKLDGVVDITEGAPSMYALRSDARVVSWGYDSSRGSLGSGTDLYARSYPDFVLGTGSQPITDIVRVFQMGEAGMAQQSDGTLLQWGWRQCTGVTPSAAQSRLAVEETALPDDVVQATGDAGVGTNAIFRIADGSVQACGDNRGAPFQNPVDHYPHAFGDFGPENPAIDVDTRGLEWWVVTDDGRVWVKTWDPFVLNVSGGSGGVLHEFPLPAGSPVVDVEADSLEVHLRRADGTLITFGQNTNGATGRTTDFLTPAPADIAGFVIGSSADVWNGLALVVPETLLGADGWTPPQPEVEVSAIGASGPEGGQATAGVSLDRPAASDLTVRWSFDGATGTVVVPAGQTGRDIDLTLPGVDGIWGADRSRTLELISVTGGARLVDETATIIVVDIDPPPTMTITPTSVAEGDGALTGHVITLTLSGPAAIDLDAAVAHIDGTARAGTDFGAVDVELAIPAGITSVTFPIVVFGNTDPEPDRSFALRATSQLLRAVAPNMTIVDDDPLAVVATSARVAAGETALVRLRVPTLPDGESVTVDWASVDGSATSPADFEAGAGTVVIDDADGATIEIVTKSVAPPAAATDPQAALLTTLEVVSLSVTLAPTSGARTVLSPESVVVGIDRVVEGQPPDTTTPTTTTTPVAPTTVESTVPVTIAPAPSVAPPAPTTTLGPNLSTELPATGSDPRGSLVLALCAVILGGALVIAVRTKRSSRS